MTLARLLILASGLFLLGTIQALNMPARQAILADLVERDDMMNAVAFHTMVNQTGQIIGRQQQGDYGTGWDRPHSIG